jgi:hypothetical protein
MTASEPLFTKYPAYSHAFLGRARTALEGFDREANPGDLLVAALELRFGIEARLFEYIDAALDRDRTKRKHIKEYTATKLLARLTDLNPKAQDHLILRITSEQDGASSTLAYTPVTKELAHIHGQLGNLLHFTYFWNNQNWYLNRRLDAPGIPTLLHARDLVAQGVEELAKATSGSLLNHPNFAAAVEELNEIPPDEPVPG